MLTLGPFGHLLRKGLDSYSIGGTGSDRDILPSDRSYNDII